MIYQVHHIVPKHMGGSNDPSNLVQLTIEEHANAHRELWEKHGLKEDYLAWKALSGQLKIGEIMLEKCKLGGSKTASLRKGKKLPTETVEKMKLTWTEERKINQGLKTSKKLKNIPKTEKHKQAMRGRRPNVNQLGGNNNNSKSVITPYGSFDSAMDAFRYFQKNKINIKYNTMMYRINSKNKPDWSYMIEGE